MRKRVSLKKSKEIKLLAVLGLSQRQIAKALNIHRRTVERHLVKELSEATGRARPPSWVGEIDWDEIKAEYSKGVPGTVLYEEYRERGLVPVTYSNFLRHLKAKLPSKQVDATMRRIFKPGERVEIDYADGIDILDPATGKIVKTELFVGCLCYSRYTFAEFTFTQNSEDFLSSHRHMFEFFEGVPQILTPDNLKSAVTKAHRYDPDVNQAYAKLARHYQCGVVPARVRRPKDKAIAERTIQIFQRWFYFKVRRKTFTSLWELNQCLREALVEFNNKNHRIFRQSRSEMFAFEKQHLKNLPENPYQVQAHKQVTVHPDCHISFDKNFYSVPSKYRGLRVDLWYSKDLIEIYVDSDRVAIHRRSHHHANFVTNKEHYPESHQAYWDVTVKSIRTKASKLGPHISKLIHELLSPPEPLRYLRRCQGIVRLSDKYGKEALDKACELAIRFKKKDTRFIERLLKRSDLLQEKPESRLPERGANPFIRGSEYFNQNKDQ